MSKINLSKISSFLLINLIIASVFFPIPKKTFFNNLNTQKDPEPNQNNLLLSETTVNLLNSNSNQSNPVPTDNFVFDQFYFQGDLDKLWQINSNYKKALEMKSQKIIDFKFLSNLLNQQKLIFEKGIEEKTIYQTTGVEVKTLSTGLIKIFFNDSKENEDYARIGNLIYQFDALLTELKATNFIVDDNFKSRFSTDAKTIDEFLKRIDAILGSNFDINNNPEYKKIIDQITKISAQTLVSRQTTLLKILIEQYPEWFKANDKIDLNNNWDTKWENEYNLKLIKISDLVENLTLQKIKIDQLIAPLKRYITERKSLVLKLTTNKAKLLQINLLLSTGYYYNPFIKMKFNNKIIFSEIVGLLSDFLRYVYWKSQNTDQKDVLLTEWDATKITEQILAKIRNIIFELINKIKLYFDVKKLSISENYFNRPVPKKELNLSEILSIFSSLFGYIKSFLDDEIKKPLAKINSNKWIIDLKNQIKNLAKVRISSNILLQPDDFKEIIDSNLQKRIIALLKANSANLRQIYQKIVDGSEKTNVYYEKNIVENLRIQKYIPDPVAEQKKFLLVNIFDKTTFNDYNLLLRKENGIFKIIYFGRSFFQKQYKDFIARENDTISNVQLKVKFSSYPEIKDKILLIKKYKLTFANKFNLKGEDFENDGKIKDSKLNDRNFTNEQRNAVWNMKIKDLNDILFGTIIKKLIDIKSEYDTYDASDKQNMEAVFKYLNIDIQVLTTDIFYLYKNDQLKIILDLDVTKLKNLIYFFQLTTFLKTNKNNFSFLKLFNIDIFQTLEIKLSDFDFDGNFINLQKLESFKQSITKEQVDLIKSTLSVDKIQAEFKKQSVTNQKKITYMEIFLNLKNELLASKPSIFSTILTKIGINLNEVPTNKELLQKITDLTTDQKAELELYGSMYVINKYYEANKTVLEDGKSYRLLYWKDILNNWVDWSEYWYQYDYDDPFKNGAFNISDAQKRSVAENYNQANTLTLDEKTFLRKMYTLKNYVDNWGNLFEPVYLVNDYWRTIGKVPER